MSEVTNNSTYFSRFDNLTANGMYNINGSVGGWFGSTFTSGATVREKSPTLEGRPCS